MVKFYKKKKRFDEDADWIPHKGRVFKMKAGTEPGPGPQPGPEPQPEPQPQPQPPPEPQPGPQPQPAKNTQKLYSDAEGLDMAYADSSNMFLDSQGTLFVAGTKGGFLGQEWIENYKTMGIPLIGKMLGISSDYSIEENERYKQIDDFIKAHPGQVKNMVGHSKGSAVIDVWMKSHPEFEGKARLYATPYEDVLGKEAYKDHLNTFNALRNAEYEGQCWKNPAEKWLEDRVVDGLTSFLGLDKVKGMKERNELRLTTPTDPATILDTSAEREGDPNWLQNAAKGFGHDYHYIADRRQGFEGDGSGVNKSDRVAGFDPNYRVPVTAAPIDNTVKTTWDTQPFNPFGITNTPETKKESE